MWNKANLVGKNPARIPVSLAVYSLSGIKVRKYQSLTHLDRWRLSTAENIPLPPLGSPTDTYRATPPKNTDPIHNWSLGTMTHSWTGLADRS